MSATAARRPLPHDDGSRQLAAHAYGLLILLAAPVLMLDINLDNGRYRTELFGPVECASMAILEYAPAAKPVAQLLMLPAAYSKRLSKLLKFCLDKDAQRCDPSPLLSWKHMMQEADLTPLLGHFKESFTPNNLHLLFVGSTVVTFAALASMRRPVRLGALGLLLVVYACYMTDAASFMPTLIMESFLGGYVLFYDQSAFVKKSAAGGRRASSAKSGPLGKGSQVPAASSSPATKAGSPPVSKTGSPPASGQKQRKKVDVKKLYDI